VLLHLTRELIHPVDCLILLDRLEGTVHEQTHLGNGGFSKDQVVESDYQPAPGVVLVELDGLLGLEFGLVLLPDQLVGRVYVHGCTYDLLHEVFLGVVA